MAGGRSDLVQRQLDRLVRFGAVGTLSDAQLLDRFVKRRDAAAEAAFEELVVRHGPMVLRVGRSVLRDAHDAEDAFQAVFLILANRAGSIQRKGSVASWLFGVAQRVATRARRTSARRHALEQRVASRFSEGTFEDRSDLDREILHEEINGLPEGLRAPIVLCYLQGLTYAAAARQLGLSEMTIRGRLARARERLGRRLTGRGVTVSAGLLAAGAAGQVQAAVPLTLIRSTIRIALGFVAGNSAAILARGVLTSMLLNQLRIAAALLVLGLGGSYTAWQAVAGDGKNDPAPEGPKVPTVQLIHPHARTIHRTVGQPSFVESSRRTPIYARESGYIEKTMVDIGDRVKSGDVLATVLVPGLVEKAAAKTEAVRRAEQRLELARKQVEVAEAEVNAARAAVAEAKAIVVKYQAEVDRWDVEVERLDREVKRGIVDHQVLIDSANHRKQSIAARDAAQASIAKTEAELLAKEAALAKAKIELSVAEADLAVARNGLQGADTNVEAALARLARAREAQAQDHRDVDRWGAELRRLRQAVAERGPRTPARDEALAAVQTAEERLRAYRALVSKADVDVSVAAAALAVARIEPPRDKDKTGRVPLTAPHDGLIVERSAHALEVVKPPAGDHGAAQPGHGGSSQGTAPLFVLDRIDPVRVVLEVPEPDARSIRAGTPARVSIKGYRDEPVEATVARTSWALNVKSRALRVEIELPNPDGRLLPGMYAYPKVLLERPDVRALPLSAVTTCGDKSYCWILEEGRAVRTEIRTGVSDGTWVEVERRAPASETAHAEHRRWTPWDGSEQVIVGDISTLRDGSPVRVDPKAGGLE
jgi:RNA polymerase sigma factor (sigma-70 family)